MGREAEERRVLIQHLREASKVQRAHAIPHHGEYTVGQHSFDALNLLLVLHPNPTMALIKAVMWHDVPERWTGDIPAPAKWSDGEFGKHIARIELDLLKRIGIEEEMRLNARERVWLHAVDKIELLLWSKEQVFMGNGNAAVIIGALASWFAHNRIPAECKTFVEGHKIDRRPDELP